MEHAGPILFIMGIVLVVVKALNEYSGKITDIYDYGKNLDLKIESLANVVHGLKCKSEDGLNILIFDDEKDSAWQVQEALRAVSPGCNVTTADNMNKAMFVLNTGNLDIVFSDQRHHTQEYGTVLKAVMKEQGIEAKFILYSAGKKPEKYDGIFLDKFDIMKTPEILKEYL